ncbi:nucleotidyltransferase family protein [Phytopseudomonas flavescens]|uniref:nucleotidyltransferase family protein n=1 Tax=Phytopseudomonas flavescens TaxID=29435 RepID=UPI001C3FEFA3|nr:nucleotidyltransferase family protein [Pseudomonas flavescens]
MRQSSWFMEALRGARQLELNDWCIGAGAVRNLVWDHLHGHPEPSYLADVDLAYFEPLQLSAARDAELQAKLSILAPRFPWEVTNQAAVHLWFESCFGHAVEPLQSLCEAVASWPEFATSVAVSLDAEDGLHIIAPHGLDDLFDMRVQCNPARVSEQIYRQRVEQKRYRERWPLVSVVLDDFEFVQRAKERDKERGR